jgi:hypothetical protein
MSDKNLEQRIKIKFYVKIGKRATKTLDLLKLTYGEYAVKKQECFNDVGGSRNGKKC